MGKRAATGGFDASGIDTEAWEVLEGQLEATIPNYDRVNTWMTFGQDKRWRRNVRNHAQPGMKVLEVGCGPGSFAEDLIGMELTCLDPSPEMLATAQPRVDAARAARGEGPAEYVQAIAENIPLPDDTFDMVFCLFSFRDFQDKAKGLEEIYRVLKPGGQLVICDAGKANKLHGFFGYLWMNSASYGSNHHQRKESSLERFGCKLYSLRDQRLLPKDVEGRWLSKRARSSSLSTRDGQSFPRNKAGK